jgi:hypothetical protein
MNKLGASRKNMYIPTKCDEIDTDRYMSQSGLMSFVDNLKGNSFNEVVFEQTEKLQEKLRKKIKEFTENQDESCMHNAHYLHIDTGFIEDKLNALAEMNIVYAYKDFEINLKKLISAAYQTEKKEFYKWETIMEFLKTKDIKPSKLEGFKEVNDLRNLNNHLKHSVSSKIDSKIKGIKEFNGQDYLEHESISLFYKRIKNVPYTFLYAVSSEIYKDLFEYDTNRLEQLAKKIALRMERKSATILIDELNKLY